MDNIGRQLAEQGLKSKLRRVRYAKTRQRRFLANVGVTYRLIDQSWMEKTFQKNIDDLEAQEKDILEKLHDFNEPPDD